MNVCVFKHYVININFSMCVGVVMGQEDHPQGEECRSKAIFGYIWGCALHPLVGIHIIPPTASYYLHLIPLKWISDIRGEV